VIPVFLPEHRPGERLAGVPLIDMVTEAALRTGMLGQLTALGHIRKVGPECLRIKWPLL
jgi:hypothetical protein